MRNQDQHRTLNIRLSFFFFLIFNVLFFGGNEKKLTIGNHITGSRSRDSQNVKAIPKSYFEYVGSQSQKKASLSSFDYQVAPNGWSEGECKGKAGWFPSAYIQRQEKAPASKII